MKTKPKGKGTTKASGKKRMTLAEDKAFDKKRKIKEGSKADNAQDKRNGVKDSKKMPQRKPNKAMGGKELLAKGMQKVGNGY